MGPTRVTAGSTELTGVFPFADYRTDKIKASSAWKYLQAAGHEGADRGKDKGGNLPASNAGRKGWIIGLNR